MRMFTLVSLFLLPIGLCSAQDSRVPWSSFTMGYAASHAGNTAVKAVVGQSIAGEIHGSNFQLIGGFLANPLLINVVVGVAQRDNGIPAAFALAQNYPNPFNPSTIIHFDIPMTSSVTLKLYNVLGQEVRTLVDEVKTPGRYDVRLDAAGLASGAYFYRIHAGSFVAVKKLLLLR